jgi:hypothetical protein
MAGVGQIAASGVAWQIGGHRSRSPRPCMPNQAIARITMARAKTVRRNENAPLPRETLMILTLGQC